MNRIEAAVTFHVVRHPTLAAALASAGRLAAKYGQKFAVRWDDAGYGPNMTHPYAVVSFGPEYLEYLDC